MTTSGRRIATALASMTLIAGAAACGGPSAGSASGSVTVGVIPGSNAAALYVAQQRNFFKEQGLDVKLEIQQNAAAIVPAVLNGQTTIGVAATSPVLTAADKGLPLRIVTGQEACPDDPQADPSGVFVAPGSPIKRPRDLSGKKVAVNALGAALELATRVLIDKDGGDSSKTQFVALTFPTMQDAVKTGKVDAAVAIEPFKVALESAHFTDIGGPFTGSYRPGDALSVYFTSKKFATENAQIVGKFTTAMTKAVQLIQKDPDEARAVIPGYSGIPASVVKTMTINRFSNDVPADGLRRLSAEMVQYKFIKAPVDPASLLPTGKG